MKSRQAIASYSRLLYIPQVSTPTNHHIGKRQAEDTNNFRLRLFCTYEGADVRKKKKKGVPTLHQSEGWRRRGYTPSRSPIGCRECHLPIGPFEDPGS